MPLASVLTILLTSPVLVTLLMPYVPAPVLISASPASLAGSTSVIKSASNKPVPSSTTVLNGIALTAPDPAALRPSTVSVAIFSRSARSTLPALTVTQPSVTSNLVSSKLASPLSDCEMPVASALVVAASMFSLLCAICAVPDISALTTESAVKAMLISTCLTGVAVLVVVIVISLDAVATPLAHSSIGPSITLPCLPPGAVSTSAARPSAGFPSLNTPVNTSYVISTILPSMPTSPSITSTTVPVAPDIDPVITSPAAKPPPNILPASSINFFLPVETSNWLAAILLYSTLRKFLISSRSPRPLSTYALVAASASLTGTAKLVIVLPAAFKSSVIGTAPFGASTPGPSLLATGAPVTS